MEQMKKIFFRGTEEDSWRWKQVAAERRTTLDSMLRDAAELYIQIPQDDLAEARAWIADRFGRKRKKGDGAQPVKQRAVIVQTEEEAELVERLLKAHRAQKQPVCAILTAIAEAA